MGRLTFTLHILLMSIQLHFTTAAGLKNCWMKSGEDECPTSTPSICTFHGHFNHATLNFTVKSGRCAEPRQIKDGMECKATANGTEVSCSCDTGDNCNQYDAAKWDKKISEAFFLANPNLAVTTVSATNPSSTFFDDSTMNVIVGSMLILSA